MKRWMAGSVLIGGMILSLVAHGAPTYSVRASDLRCESVSTPLAVEEPRPVFSWIYSGERSRGITVKAVRLLVANTQSGLRKKRAVLWDSGWITPAHFSLRYAGPTLTRDTRYFWNVETRDMTGRVTSADKSAQFFTADNTWTAHWIRAPWSTVRDGAELDSSLPMPIFRREFYLSRMPVSAVLRIAGLGHYEARIDGKPIAPGALCQAWTDYRKTVTYDSYDLTNRLKPGKNVLGVMLGNGMYNVQQTKGRYTKFAGSFGPPTLIAELYLRYANGSSTSIATDSSWSVARGPIVFSSVYGGEDFDARRSLPGWDKPRFADTGWDFAKQVDGPGGQMVAALAPLVQVKSSHAAVDFRIFSPTRTVYDMGQNVAGWPEITVSGPKGAVLRLTAGELLNSDGTVSQQSTGGPQWWTYTLRGDKVERWTPQFSYWGFRYLQADWIVGSDTADTVAEAGRILSITSKALTSTSATVGTFESSNRLLNSIHRMTVQSMHNNEVSLFTDCPHREKLGWLEEAHLVAPGLLFNNDLERLYAAEEHNIADVQKSDGMVPTTAPQYTVFGPTYSVYDDSPEWGSASILAPWASFRFNGSIEALERNYPTMQRYLQYLEGRSENGIVAYGLGDWYDIGAGEPGFEKNTTLGVTATLMLYEDAVVMQRIARLLGRADDAAKYQALVDHEKVAFNRRFWDDKAGYYDRGSQTANAMPLALDIAPAEQRSHVIEHILSDIHAHHDHITTGEVGYPYMMRALLNAGRSDVLLAMMLRTDPPSYASQLARGATTLTEAWDANPRNSQDHFMLGDEEEWFYRGLGGIDIDFSREVDSERITIRPRIVSGLSWVRSTFQSRKGKIESAWESKGGETKMIVSIPIGAEATVYVPVIDKGDVLEGAVPAERAVGVTFLRREANAAVYRVVSGDYKFRVPSAVSFQDHQ
jgi:alpha-L-rhamnosidase